MFFSTDSDSPVRAASWTRRLTLSIRRASAGTALPVSSTMTSPGTSSRAESSSNLPSRRTRTTGTAICLREAIARSARYSEANPSTPNRTTIAPMAAVSIPLPSSADTTAATIRIRTIVCVNCSSSMRRGPLLACSCSSLGPYCRRRPVASAVVRPFSDADKAANTSSFDCVCQSRFVTDILQAPLWRAEYVLCQRPPHWASPACRYGRQARPGLASQSTGPMRPSEAKPGCKISIF